MSKAPLEVSRETQLPDVNRDISIFHSIEKIASFVIVPFTKMKALYPDGA